MRKLVGISILLLPLGAVPGVYKWVGPDGQAHYSDRPVSGAERVGIQVDHGASLSENPDLAEESSADLGPFSSFEIVNPQPNQTLRDAEGRVGLSLLVEPPLSEEHRLQILVNGQPVPGQVLGTQIQLQGLSFGSHRVQARIQDDLDVTVASTPVVAFHLLKPLPEDSRP